MGRGLKSWGVLEAGASDRSGLRLCTTLFWPGRSDTSSRRMGEGCAAAVGGESGVRACVRE